MTEAKELIYTMKKTENKTQEDTMIKLVLTVNERLNMPALKLPNGSIVENDMADAVLKRFELTEAEKKEYEVIALPDGRVAWNSAKAKLREFRLESYEMLLLQTGVRMLDERKAIPNYANGLAKKLLEVKVKGKEELGK